jgi:hypothetical protein
LENSFEKLASDLQNRLQTMAMTYMQGAPDTMLQEELHKLQVTRRRFFVGCCKNAKYPVIRNNTFAAAAVLLFASFENLFKTSIPYTYRYTLCIPWPASIARSISFKLAKIPLHHAARAQFRNL